MVVTLVMLVLLVNLVGVEEMFVLNVRYRHLSTTIKQRKGSKTLIAIGQCQCQQKISTIKNPANGRHQLSRLMRIVGPIQIGRRSVIYLLKKGGGGVAIYPSTRGL